MRPPGGTMTGLRLHWAAFLLATLCCDGGANSASDPSSLWTSSRVHKLDVLSSVVNFHGSNSSLSLVPGPHSSAPAAFFGDASFVRGHEGLFQLLKSADNDFALLTSMRQRKGNVGTILTLTADVGRNEEVRLFELQSSGRQNVLRLHYRSWSAWTAAASDSAAADSVSHVPPMATHTIPVGVADENWHRLAITISGNQLQVFLDCQSVYRRVISSVSVPAFVTASNLTLWVGQQQHNAVDPGATGATTGQTEASTHFVYKGYLQNLMLASGPNAHLLQCPLADTVCPSCGEFRSLQETVLELNRKMVDQINDLRQRLSLAESRISSFESCDCPKSCRLEGGVVQDDGASWTQNCQICSCVRGEVSCRAPMCPALNCSDPLPADPASGLCCPTCKAQCRSAGKLYPDGARWTPTACVRCECFNGSVRCINTNPKKECPALDCPPDQQRLEEGMCCKVCVVDHCSNGHDCHPMATCLNGLFNYTCHCPDGFLGDGRQQCNDIDECKDQRFVHHCSSPNSKCVNTVGSYKCECLSGFRESASGSCDAVDACEEAAASADGGSACPDHAVCVAQTEGGFKCLCNDGYQMENDKCSPVCPNGCSNGGVCSSPGVCSCAHGFSGETCNDDVDECALGQQQHQCAENAVCVNKPGWHFCECASGFRSFRQWPNASVHCVDMDECAEKTHTCSLEADCVNTVGGYECHCRAGRNCSKACLVSGSLRASNSTWRDGCSSCTCQSGRAVCTPLPCDCGSASATSGSSSSSSAPEDPACCPQCAKQVCSHRSDSGEERTYRSGQTWTYQCQQCECAFGQVDCWPLDCPPVAACTNGSAVAAVAGACCPSCAREQVDFTDAFSVCNDHNDDSSNASASTWGCSRHGRMFVHGQAWSVRGADSSECANCRCTNGSIYCSSANSCAHSELVDLPLAVRWRQQVSAAHALGANKDIASTGATSTGATSTESGSTESGSADQRLFSTAATWSQQQPSSTAAPTKET